jgi:Uma2 family endonuclease
VPACLLQGRAGASAIIPVMSSISPTTDSRVILQNVRWETYEALLEARADASVPRFTYDRGTLEIMSPPGKHERLKTLLGRFVETYTLERRVPVRSAGSTTLKNQLKEKGLEPDESYYVSSEALVREKDDIDLTLDPPPDLAIEIDLRTSPVDKLGIHASLGVAEVWSRDEKGMVVFQLQTTGKYVVTERSGVFPDLPITELDRFLGQRSSLDETTLVHAFRDWVVEKFGTR